MAACCNALVQEGRVRTNGPGIHRADGLATLHSYSGLATALTFELGGLNPARTRLGGAGGASPGEGYFDS